jgi:hypothetical protein
MGTYYSQKTLMTSSVKEALLKYKKLRSTDANLKLFREGLAAYNQGKDDIAKSEQDLFDAQRLVTRRNSA